MELNGSTAGEIEISSNYLEFVVEGVDCCWMSTSYELAGGLLCSYEGFKHSKCFKQVQMRC